MNATPRDLAVSPRCYRRGFALIIVVSLLALLVLALVSLATLTRIETQVGANSRKQAQARQNARFALDLAVGELQRHAGPDTRITSESTILNASAANAHFVGVWNREGGLRTWLVSGNENYEQPLNPSSNVAGVLSSGRRLVKPEIAREQRVLDGAWESLVSPNTTTVGAVENYVFNEFRLGGALSAALLVGPKSAGATAAQIEGDRYVLAPLQPLQSTNPSGSGSVDVGRYAWWIGDEGVKARANLVDRYAGADASSVAGTWRISSAQRTGIEGVLSDYTANSPLLDRVLVPNQLTMTGSTGLADLRAQFHSMTFMSRGVLANTVSGGLRRDLTRALQATNFSGLNDNDAITFTQDGVNWISAGGMNWGRLRAYHNLRPILPWDESSTIAAINPQVSAFDRTQVCPLITAVMIEVTIYNDTGAGRTRVALRPVVIMANPYDVALTARDYRISISQSTIDPSSVEAGWSASFVNPSDGSVEELFSFPADSYGEIVSASPGNRPLNLDIPNSVGGFSAGQVRAYSLSGPVGGYNPSSGIDLASGINSGGYVYDDCDAHIPSPWTSSVSLSVASGPLNLTLQISSDGGARWTTAQEIIGIGSTAASTSFVPPMGSPDFLSSGLQVTEVFHVSRSDASTNQVRWLAQHNPRARVIDRGSGSVWGTAPPFRSSAGAANRISEPLFGASYLAGVGTGRVALFHVPRRNPVSLAEFQHAELTGTKDGAYPTGNLHPAYVVGNSYASPYTAVTGVDHSYGVNAALWDRFFLSGFTTATLPAYANASYPNMRLVPRSGYQTGEAMTYDNASSKLMIDGAFNVNSTSVDAWEAVLGSLNGTSIRYYDAVLGSFQTATNVSRPFFRSTLPLGDAAAPWRGFRSLEDWQVRALAENIVDQVRRRGPFRSLAEFVNRRLPTSNTFVERGLIENQMGALQAALDGARAGQTPYGGTGTLPDPAINPGAGLVGSVAASPPGSLQFSEAATGNLSANAPGWLSQADVLSALGPILAVRSDTFLVRTYGDSLNPTTGQVEARAWCEAIVQRVPEYVDSSDAAPDVHDPTQAASAATRLSAANQTFGRRFVITSFRWLSPDDI